MISVNQARLHAFLRNPSADDGRFAGDPMAVALGARLLQLDPAAGSLRLAFEPAALFLQGEGVIQGGAVCAMLDVAMAFLVLASLPLGQGCATTNLHTAFQRPVAAGPLQVEARLEQRGRLLFFARASLCCATRPDRLLASASATLAVQAPR